MLTSQSSLYRYIVYPLNYFNNQERYQLQTNMRQNHSIFLKTIIEVALMYTLAFSLFFLTFYASFLLIFMLPFLFPYNTPNHTVWSYIFTILKWYQSLYEYFSLTLTQFCISSQHLLCKVL